MSTIVTRAGKGSALTHTEVDNNFINLNTDKIEAAQSVTLTNKTISGSSNTLSNIGNSSLTNSSVTIGSTSVSLGSTATTVSGLTLSSPTVSGGTINGATIGASTPSTGAFTTLSASSTVSGTGFSTYLASPPAIGGTAAAAGSFTTLSATGVATFRAGSNSAPAITTSGDTNTGVFFPAADTVAIGTGGTERLRVDSAGNAGLGVTPNTWYSGTKALEIGATTALMDISGQTNLYQNAYLNAAGNQIYKTTNFATQYRSLNGQHQWFTAPSGTAGNAITFTQAMTLDASGNLGVGATSPLSPLDITRNTSSGSSTAYPNIRLDNQNATGYTGVYFYQSGTSKAFFELKNDVGALTMGTGSTERARITSGGIFCINTTAALEGTSALQVRGGILGDNSSADVNFNIEARGAGTIYSDSIYSSTTATGASVSITGTAGYLQRSTSSIKYKTNVEDLDQSRSEVIFQMRPVWYRSICELDRKDWSYYGLIAEEVAEIEPRLVHWGKVKEDGSQEPEGVMYDRLTVLLLAEMKKLKAIVDAQAAKIAALETA